MSTLPPSPDPLDPSDLSGGAGTASAGGPTAAPARIRPSGWWYALAGGIAALGAVAGVWMIVAAFQSSLGAVDDYARVSAPGSAVVFLEEGRQTIFAEYPYSGYWYDASPPYVEVYDVASGDELTWYPTYSTTTYDVGSRHGISIGTIDVPADGRYEVVVSGGSSAATAVAIGDEMVLDAVVGVFGGMAVGGLGVLVGGIVALVVGVKRGKAKKALRPTPRPGPWGPPGGGWGPPPGSWGPPPGQQGWGPPQGQPGWGPPQGQPGWGAPQGQGGWAPPPPTGQPGGWAPPQGQPGGWAPPPRSAPSGQPGGWAPPPAPSPGPDQPGWAAPGQGPVEPPR